MPLILFGQIHRVLEIPRLATYAYSRLKIKWKLVFRSSAIPVSISSWLIGGGGFDESVETGHVA